LAMEFLTLKRWYSMK